MTNDYQSETAFLRQLILYDDTLERRQLDERITQAQQAERCVGRAVVLMAFFTGLALAGLGYSALFLDDFPRVTSQFAIRAFSGLGVTSVISLLAFACLRLIYRRTLNQRREECRRLVVRLLESRLGKPRTVPLPGFVKEQEIGLRWKETVSSTAEIVRLPNSRKHPASGLTPGRRN